MEGSDQTGRPSKGGKRILEMSQLLSVSHLNRTDFAPYGDVIEISGPPDKIINAGMCGRYHDRASLDFSDGRAGISLFDAKARHLPYVVDMLERHPEGSQAFIPMTQTRFLVIVAQDKGGAPSEIRAFLTQPGQAVNLHRGVWHGVLAPFEAPGLYAVVDRIGAGTNLEEHWLATPYVIETVPA
jgi:ureidoglycolate lyase